MNREDIMAMNQSDTTEGAWIAETMERILTVSRSGREIRSMSDKELGMTIRRALNSARAKRLAVRKRLIVKYESATNVL